MNDQPANNPADGPDRDDPWSDVQPPDAPALALSLGNSTAAMGRISGFTVDRVRRLRASDHDAVAQAVAQLAGDTETDTLLLASVNAADAEAIALRLRDAGAPRPIAFGPSMPVPIATNVPEPSRVGQDRLLTALAAAHTLKQACIVIDAGTALTVDFVDGHGVFQGGAIVPGAQAMLDALHQNTDALPKLNLADMPDPLEPYGKTTEHAMLLGARAAVRGTIRYLAEQYAIHYDAYPRLIATGGDAAGLLEGDELIDAIVPDLELIGIAVARARLAHEPDHDEP